MDLLRLQKYSSHKDKLLMLSIFLALLFDVEATNIGTPIPINEDLITDIDYKYQLFHNNQNDIDCSGVLNLSINLPQDTKSIILERSEPHVSSGNDIRFLIKSEYPSYNTATSISISNIYWGTYFRICVILTDGNREYSPTYFINKYLDPDDLKLLEGLSAIENIGSDSFGFVVKDKSLYIETSDTISLSIFDLSGKHLFTGDIYRPTVIPLTNFKQPVILIKCIKSNSTITKKLFLQ